MSSSSATSRLPPEQTILPPAHIRTSGISSSIYRIILLPSDCSLSTPWHLKFKRLRPRETFLADSQANLAIELEAQPIASFLRPTDFDSICFSRASLPMGNIATPNEFISLRNPPRTESTRPYLAIIRCGANHRLVDDGSQRNFDIALSLYACPNDKSLLDGCEYSYSGGINKYKAAYQFIDGALLEKFRGFIFLDDDLEITYSHLVSSWIIVGLTGSGWHNPA